MGRPYTGKQSIGKRREVRPNGDVYIYERITKYDQETKKTRTVSTRLLGKIPAGSTEMVPTRPKKKKGEKDSAPVQAVRTHAGLQKILDWAGRESGIDADLKASFSEGDALKLMSIGRYWLASGGDTLPRMKMWQVMNPLPYQYPVTEDVYGELFRNIGRCESGPQSYFMLRAAREGEGLTLALDTTAISTWSTNQIEARKGFGSSGDGLNTVKMLVLHSVESGQPVAFARQPGNIPDRTSLENALRQLELLGLPAPVVVADNGFYSQDNMTHAARSHTKFLMLASASDRWVREAIDAARADLEHFGSTCPFDFGIRGCTRSRTHEFAFTRRRTRGSFSRGESESFTRRLYVHIYFKPGAAADQERRLNDDLMSLKTALESGTEEFAPAALKRIEKYLTVRRTASGVKVGFNMEAIAEARRYWGYFVLVSNSVRDTFTALKAYRSREKIEELFAVYKEDFDGRRPRVWSPESLHGRQFAQFVGLGYHCFISDRIRAVRESLCKDTAGKTQEELTLEKQLKSWLEKHSLVQILDWFRCVDYVEATGKDKTAKWMTETTRRDRLFLKLLGVPQ